MVTTRAQSRAAPLKIDVDSTVIPFYFAEGAAHVVYQLHSIHTGLSVSINKNYENLSSHAKSKPPVDPRFKRKLLRLRKDVAHAVPVGESYNYFKETVEPLFPEGSLLEQELCEVSSALLKKLNKELRHDEKKEFLRERGRAGSYLAVDETYGTLITSMLWDDDHACCDFKPKWLTQSPSAPAGARHCRTCALRAKRGLTQDLMAFCPLALTSSSEGVLAEQLEWALMKMRGAPLYMPKELEYAIPFFKESPMIARLKELQERFDPNGPLKADPKSEEFRLAMTLRDCTMFMKIPNQGKGRVEARFGDFDLKSGDAGKAEYWRRTEQSLIDEGWYTCTGKSQGSGGICQVRKQG